MHFYYVILVTYLFMLLHSGCMGYVLSLLFMLHDFVYIAYTYLKFGAQSGYEPFCLVMRQCSDNLAYVPVHN